MNIEFIIITDEGFYVHCTILRKLKPRLAVNLIILKTDSPMIAKTDEIGEICISSIGCGTGYFGLPGKSEQSFKVRGYIEAFLS